MTPGIGRTHPYVAALPPPAERVDAFGGRPVALLAGEDCPLRHELGQALRQRGWEVHHGQRPPEESRLDAVLAVHDANQSDPGYAFDGLVHALALARDTQPALRADSGGRSAFLTVTRLDGRLGTTGTASRTRSVLGGLPGLVKTLGIEAPELFCRAVDVSPGMDDGDAAAAVLAELYSAEERLPQVGVDEWGRWTLRLGEQPPPPTRSGTREPEPDDLFVVTGGGRGVTATCVTELARRYRPGFLLLGRTPLEEEPEWARSVPDERLKEAAATEIRNRGDKPTPRAVDSAAGRVRAQREIRATLDGLREAGSSAEYLAVDATDAEATTRALRPYSERVTGLIHGAGVLTDRLIADKDEAEARRVLAAKLDGLEGPLTAVDRSRLRHVVLFSSVAGFFGNRGQSDYAMANEALNRIAWSLREDSPETVVTSINWGAWAGGMVTPELERMFAERGVPLIQPETGAALFAEQFAAERGDDTVVVVGPNTPLSAPSSELPAEGVTVRRALEEAARSEVVADHTVGGTPVLPATAALGAMLRIADDLGIEDAEPHEFRVLKGVSFDGAAPEHLDFRMEPEESTGFVVTASDPAGRPRYRAVLRTGVAARADTPEREVTGVVLSDAAPYADGTLFHGPLLRGIRQLGEGPEKLVSRCRLPDHDLARGAYGTANYSPVLADLLLQAALVRIREQHGLASLPSGIGAVERFSPLPDDSDFLVTVTPADQAAGCYRCTVTAVDPTGRVLLRFRDVELVANAALEGKFFQ
ncbi:SDR family NAD(P)-dependent oxidoreductase [Actinopolyspora mortivallis]|uniref:SDR family NAD(P)-dependent oxidoreductase n=1 Tax=Actinopolyspora mortivallis TaxID=33906 RepID=UPI0006849144|nr:SDR family NAD(P)-dependent oxidoreductase [Actinopolyspora mortivallis]